MTKEGGWATKCRERGAKVVFMGTSGELGITAWVGKFPVCGRKDHQELCSSQGGLWGLSFTSPVPSPLRDY